MKHNVGIQLEMNFDGPKGNRFRNKMNDGVFQVLLEVTPPPDNTPMEDAVARFAEVEYTVSARTDLSAALALVERRLAEAGLDGLTDRAAGELAAFRREELACALCRLRGLSTGEA